MTEEDMEFLIGVAVFLVILGMAIYFLYQSRAKKKQAEPGKNEVQCPKCQSNVPHDAPYCKHCGAEFVKDELACPECGENLHLGAKRCKCGHGFEEKEEYVCPKCGKPVESSAKKCPECHEEFWAPIRPPSKD